MPHTFLNLPSYLPEAPSAAQDGACYYDTGLNQLRFYENGAWVGLGAAADTVPSYTQSAALTDNQRFQLAQNTGSLVSLVFNLLDEESALALGVWTIPRFPNRFLVQSVTAVIHTCGGTQISCQLRTLANEVVATGNLVNLAGGNDGGRVELALSAQSISPMSGLTFSVTQHTPGYLDTTSYGLALWIRGLWDNEYSQA